MEDLALGADQGPEFLVAEAEAGLDSAKEGLLEEFDRGGEATLPEEVGGLVAGLEVGEIDAEGSEGVGALVAVPAVGEQDAADVPEDGLDLRVSVWAGAHSPSGKSAPTVMDSQPPTSFWRPSSLVRSRSRAAAPRTRGSGGSGESTTAIIAQTARTGSRFCFPSCSAK